MTAELHDHVEEIRAVHKAIPVGTWFWKVHNGSLALFSILPDRFGWRPILRARRLGMNDATLEVVDLTPLPPTARGYPWESDVMVRVKENMVPNTLAVLKWIAEAPEHVAYLLREVDHLRAELAMATVAYEDLQRRTSEERSRLLGIGQEGDHPAA